ncbi:hypothetical protein FJT64_016301 [Amphibalanus amphitrite]|uniref:Uncharacterized protein n=1 Tax=Amphibalanus amphitrite TaxID=1232801 RepID=A0A6A4XAX7_AMPAM|nr:hypothetical protein FJT64_016301 [Amphibalanus amphitrite]
MLAHQGSVGSPSDVSFSPSVADGGDGPPQRYSGSTEDDGERDRPHGHWHLPFRKKLSLGEAATSPPKSVSFVDEVEVGSPLAREYVEEHHKEHHRHRLGHTLSHSTIGRAMSHSAIGSAVSHFFKKGHYSPPGSEAGEGAALRSHSHHTIGHAVAEFFKKGVHHSPQDTAPAPRSGTPPVEAGEDAVSSLPAGPEEGVTRGKPSTPMSGKKTASAGTAASKPPRDDPSEQPSISGMGQAVAKAFKKFNSSVVGSPGKPPRWQTWRRGTAPDPKKHRYRRRSMPGRRLSESAAAYEVSMLSLLRRRRSASRSPERRGGTPPRPANRETALQWLRRQALRRHISADFLHLRRWRRSCPDLPAATEGEDEEEEERVNEPIRHAILRRALVDDFETILLMYPGDVLKNGFRLFAWARLNRE